MWIKNLCVFQSPEPFAFSAAELEEYLDATRCPKITSQALSAEGFVPPLKDQAAMLHIGEGLLYCVYQETARLLPGAVVKEELEERVLEIEAKEGRRPGRKERADLKDEITFELMPRAFTRSRRTHLLIDTLRHRVLIDSASDTRAEQALSMLRKAVGSLPVTRPTANISPATQMSAWLKDPAQLPAGFTLGDRCELKSTSDEGASVRFTAVDLSREEILAHLETDMQVVKLNLVWNDEFEFDLTDTLQLKRIKPLDIAQDNLDNLRDDDALAELMARISLQNGLLRTVLDRLYQHFEATE